MSNLRRVPLLLVLAAMTLVITGCGSWINRTTSRNPCSTGHGSSNKQAPIICVDDSNPVLIVTPDPVTAHDVLRGTNRPVTVKWFTMSGADLTVEMKDTGCVSQVNCNAPGNCTAQTIPGAAKQCKYDVWTTPNNRLDPVIIITTCCS